MTPNATALARFGLANPVLTDQSKIATIWKVERKGRPAALKIYHDGDSKDEWPGFALLASRKGNGAVEIFDTHDGMAVMEWLDGPSLGDMSRTGNDDEASAILGTTAAALHAVNADCDLPLLTDRVNALLQFRAQSGWPQHTTEVIRAAQSLAHSMIKNQRNIRLLHGDLHHDNIRQGTRGYVAYDAKGLIGDPAYDLASAFLNPMDAPARVGCHARMIRMAAILANTTGISAKRLLDWAAVHCALTIAWKNAPVPDVTLLTTMMAAREVSPR
ncbi:aminoglycoside phosphotransferase family protein [Yoonia maritima]|uniref:aminoglycoside phosphotransferase family protein n=1 Tax=Yoonia maritima TaxID=1435347 RepID=UPI003736BF16